MKEEFKKIIEEVRALNPYPDDVFIEPNTEQYAEMRKALKDKNLVPDAFFGSWGRKVWNGCLDKIEELIEEKEWTGYTVKKCMHIQKVIDCANEEGINIEQSLECCSSHRHGIDYYCDKCMAHWKSELEIEEKFRVSKNEMSKMQPKSRGKSFILQRD